MIEYISTRGNGGEVSSAYAIKKGLASDGGLFFPKTLPSFSNEEIRKQAGEPYYKRCAFVLSKFLTDYTVRELEEDCLKAYSSFTPSPAPIHRLADGVRMLELWHGATCAFKDMALQIMPKLLSRALIKTGEKKKAYILVATSGDTGKAALEGYKNAEGINMMVYYPVNGVSRIQKLQMATQEGDNVEVRSVSGNFDDAQNGVKKIFSDSSAAKELSDRGYILSSANSINWGRLAPQIAYYISAYCDLVADGTIAEGELIDVTVPTGNFGNILACYIAKMCGLPVGKLVCASNRNNILTDFFNTGVYDRNRDFYTTISPSMDILISSNLERLLFIKLGSEKTAELMASLKDSGRFEVSADVMETIREDFTGLFSSEEQTKERIRKTFEGEGYLIDTHTAVALDCAERYRAEEKSERTMLVVSTASPFKFASSVLGALGRPISSDEFENLDTLAEYTSTPAPAPLASLKEKPVRFDPDSPIDRGDMLKELIKTL